MSEQVSALSRSASLRRAWIGLGSNLGDRRSHLAAGIAGLAGLSRDGVRTSDVWESASVGGPRDAPPFLNAVAEIATDLAPWPLVQRLLAIEAGHGRCRGRSGAPRTLDLDLLWVEGVRSDDPRAEVPHPRLWDRRFVLAPLSQLAPGLVCERSRRSVAGALDALPDDPSARWMGPLVRPDTPAVDDGCPAADGLLIIRRPGGPSPR